MKEFFEMFEIEPEIEENYCISNYDDCPISTQCCCPENCTKCDNYEKEHEVYPPITSDIVLGLEEIILDKFELNVLKQKDTFNNIQYSYYIHNYNSDELTDAYMEAHRYSRKDTLLYICIQLKDEIQYQVRALFNAR